MVQFKELFVFKIFSEIGGHSFEYLIQSYIHGKKEVCLISCFRFGGSTG